VKNFDKKDIEEVCAMLGIELTEQPYASKPYLNACCPLHVEKKPSFVVFPEVQRWVCYSCAPEGGDVIDLVQRVRGCTFKEALEIAATPIPDEEAFRRSLVKTQIQNVDVELLLRRATGFFDHPRRFDFSKAQAILQKFDGLIYEQRYLEADKHLREYGF
jgi:DNA primase